MAPTITPGSKLKIEFAPYMVKNPNRWDIVAFNPLIDTNQLWVLRVVALPGETITYSNGTVCVNGQPIGSPPDATNVTYLSLDVIGHASTNAVPYVVPLGSYFVLGDNSRIAADSRFWGAIPRPNIVGRVSH